MALWFYAREWRDAARRLIAERLDPSAVRQAEVFRHAIGLGDDIRDITPDLRGLLEAPRVEHYAALNDPRKQATLQLRYAAALLSSRLNNARDQTLRDSRTRPQRLPLPVGLRQHSVRPGP